MKALRVLAADERLDGITERVVGTQAEVDNGVDEQRQNGYFGSSPVGRDERGENPPGKQELYVCRKPPLPMPAEAVVKDLPSARTQERKYVLKIRSGTRRGAKRRRIEWASPYGEEKDARETAAEFEATRVEVLVR